VKSLPISTTTHNFSFEEGAKIKMTNMLYYTHTGTRWLVVLALIVALGFMIYSLVSNREQDRITRIVMLTFSSLVGVQWVIGLFYYLVYGSIVQNYSQRPWVEHLSTMTVALIVAHLYLPFRRRASTRTYYIASTVILLVVAVLIYLGVSVLAGDGRWRFQPLYAPPEL
jgi:hypothetical protein